MATPAAQAQPPSRRNHRRAVIGMLGVDLIVVLGVVAYLTSPPHRQHDPVHALQQLDAFYLDEAAPAYRQLGLRPGRPALLVVCDDGCRPPAGLDAQLRVSSDIAVARTYALVTETGRLGPGYAVIDSRGNVRYRTFDPGLGQHLKEIEILLERAR